MDFQNRLKLARAALIIFCGISFLYFILIIIASMRVCCTDNNNFLRLHVLGIFALPAGAGSILLYGRWRFGILKKKISDQSKKIKQYKERYRILVESADDFIFTVDNSGRFRSLNSFTAAFFGGVPSQFIGRPLSDLFSKEVAEKQLKLVRAVFKFGKSMRDEFMVVRAEYQIWLNAHFMPRKDGNGRVISVLCIARDITENKKLEKQLINTEKLASMGTLAAGVAHEINNPLGIILGFTDLLLEGFDKNSQQYKDLKTIETQGFHCKAVVENLLSFARQGEGQSVYCDINEAISAIVDVVNHSLQMNNIELRLNMASGLPRVEGDSRQMQQIVLNLINNAVAAMKQNGILEIQTSLDNDPGKVILMVRDNGHGIQKEHIDKIFDPFFTTKSEGEGTGLGLFVSHGIINKYKGTITCESSTGESQHKPRGTVFTLTLKAKKDGTKWQEKY